MIKWAINKNLCRQKCLNRYTYGISVMAGMPPRSPFISAHPIYCIIIAISIHYPLTLQSWNFLTSYPKKNWHWNGIIYGYKTLCINKATNDQSNLFLNSDFLWRQKWVTPWSMDLAITYRMKSIISVEMPNHTQRMKNNIK